MDFYVWITLLTGGSADVIIAKLVRRGFKVQAIADSGNPMLSIDKRLSCVLGLHVTIDKIKDEKGAAVLDPSVNLVRGECLSIIESTSTKYLSIIVTTEVACAWTLGNVEQKTVEAYRSGADDATKKN